MKKIYRDPHRGYEHRAVFRVLKGKGAPAQGSGKRWLVPWGVEPLEVRGTELGKMIGFSGWRKRKTRGVGKLLGGSTIRLP